MEICIDKCSVYYKAVIPSYPHIVGYISWKFSNYTPLNLEKKKSL